MKVIVVCVDTLRWDVLGCYGRPTAVYTPNIDRFAEESTRFTRAYCGSFPTIPMRVDAYTGDVNWPRYGWKPPDADQPTVTAKLAEKGIHSALVLDTMHYLNAGLDRIFDECEPIRKPQSNTTRPEDIEIPFPPENTRQNSGGYRGDLANIAHCKHETDWYVARTMTQACNWLERNRERDDFFLWIDTFEPHEIWWAPDFYTDMYSSGVEGHDYAYPNYGYTNIYKGTELQRLRDRYAAEVTLVDAWFGYLLDRLKYMGLKDDTMVVFTADHGMYIGEHNRCGKHTVEPSDPWPLLEEVAHLPLLIRTPWADSPTVADALVQPSDLMPTILEAFGIDFDAPAGRSLLPMLKSIDSPRKLWDYVFTSFFSWEGPGRDGVEYVASLITVQSPTHTFVTGPEPHKPELYHTAGDPLQQQNVAAGEPDRVEQMRDALGHFMERQGANSAYIKKYCQL